MASFSTYMTQPIGYVPVGVYTPPITSTLADRTPLQLSGLRGTASVGTLWPTLLAVGGGAGVGVYVGNKHKAPIIGGVIGGLAGFSALFLIASLTY